MLVHQGEGSSTPTEPHHTPFPEAKTSHPTTSSISLPSMPTAPIPPAQKEEIVKLKDRVKVLEDKEDVVVTQSRDDAPIKGRSINEGEAAAERISNESKEVARVLTSMDAATVLAGGIDVPTGSGFIPTAGPLLLLFPLAVARELKEQQEKENMRMNEQIARDTEVARIHAEEELQGMINSLDKSNETIAKYLREYQDFALKLPLEKRIELISDLVKYLDNYSKVYKFQSQQRRPMTKKQKREYYMAVEDFIPMGSNEETKRLKRKGLNLEKEQLVPVEDVYVQALQVKHPIIDWKVHTEGQRSYWRIIRLGGSSACYQFFVDLLKQLDREDLNQLWALVKEYLSIRPATNDKEMKFWVELKRMYEPDPKDQLQRDSYASRRDYPLRRGLALAMISYKLQIENYSQMAEDLIRKIYNIANTPRGGLLGIKCTRHSHCQVKCSHWQYKFPLPVKVVATARRLEMPLPEVCTAIEEKKKKLLVKDR
nr:hypothetical protein [Tanacetum cinerariifolium]GEY95530.1 hypothetical protein [Tanacetum cinerariifolium]